jgi:hypothetical protein
MRIGPASASARWGFRTGNRRGGRAASSAASSPPSVGVVGVGSVVGVVATVVVVAIIGVIGIDVGEVVGRVAVIVVVTGEVRVGRRRRADRGDHVLEQAIEAAAVGRRYRERFAQAQAPEVGDLDVALGRVDLVDGQDHRLAGGADRARDLGVEGRQAGGAVDHQHQGVGLVDRPPGLAVDAAADHVTLGRGIEAAGVDHADRGAEVLELAVAAIAGQPWRIVNQGGAAADHTVEQRRLADVGSADQSDGGGHGSPR